MCGITGIINGGTSASLRRMTEVLAHRGPDDNGLQWFDNIRCGLGHRRLSIIDLSPAGHQPMTNEAGSSWIAFNGEIYNYKSIREELESEGYRFRSKSDTEVLLLAYQHWGDKCLDKLNGMFAFAIYDIVNRRLFAARDRLGIKPLYYHFEKGRLIFASEIKAILASGLIETRADLRAMHTPARFLISPQTGFENISKLPPAHFMTLEDGHLTIQRYWSIEAKENGMNESEATDRLDDLLRDAVRMQMIADVPVGVFLSGGVDSSIVSALMRANTQQDIHSFTIRFSDEDKRFEQMAPDEVYARQVATQFGFNYHELEIRPEVDDLLPKIVWQMDEPLSDPAAINTYLISKAARDLDIVVLLNGMGGDEIFGGYRKQLACLIAETYQSITPEIFQRVVERTAALLPVANGHRGFRQMRWAKRFLSFASLPRADRFLMSDLSVPPDQFAHLYADRASYYDTHFYKEQAPRFKKDGLSYLTQMCLNDTNVFLPEHNLTYSDKACMAASVESRPPLIDHRVVEYMFSLSPEARIKGMTQKYLLKKVAEKYLPRNVIFRPKAPFASPLRSWIRGPLSTMVNDLLSEHSLKARGLYDPAFVSRLIARDRQGLEDNSYLIWTFLTHEVWFRTFFQN